ncbi:MAG: DUF4434 domain-containing protein [Cytophagaceae bacterium]
MKKQITLIRKIIFGLFLPLTMYGQADKQLDNFSSAGSYYTSASGGTVSLSIANIAGQEGASCLKVNYNLNTSSGNYLEIFRSYHTSTRDLSFSPSGISLLIRGGSRDVFKFMLYEDINMNGNVFDSGDEVYQFSSSSALNNTSWYRLTIPFSSFVRIAGSGDGKLNLNKIGAWRIVINNGSGSTTAREIYFDDLRQHTTYIPATSGTQKLSGSFIQLWNDAGCKCGNWTQAQWESHMQQMKNACLDKIIVQYGVYGGHSWYSPSSLSFVTSRSQTLNRMFAAAQKIGIDIYLGLYFDETWNHSAKNQASTYSNILTKHQQVINEMHALFGSHSRFKGWYIPQEINDLEWQTTTNRNLLANWLRDVAAYAKGKNAAKKVIIAPFFGPHRPADNLKAWWDYVLSVASGVDLIIPQDGVGTTTKDVDVDIPHYFNAIKSACVARGRQFGATIETFQQTSGWPINNGTFAAVPASITRLRTQLWEAGRFAPTENLFQFEYPYMQPGLSTASQKLYDDYRLSFCNSTTISNAREHEESVETPAAFFTVTPNPFSESLQIHLNNPEIRITSVTITDLRGKILFQGLPEKGNTIEAINHLTAGSYLLFIQADDINQTIPIIKY